MAERLAGIVTQIQNVRQLGAVVTAMRGIAALRAQEGRSLLAGIEAYTDVVSHSIGQALNLLSTDTLGSTPPRHAKRGLILFCAEQGFAGPFSERVFEVAAGDLAQATSIVVGTRGAALASERGIRLDWSAAMTTRVDGIPSIANRLAEVLYGYLAQGAITAAESSSRARSPAASASIGIRCCRSILDAFTADRDAGSPNRACAGVAA